jgi:hypothetical protein
MRPQSVDMVAEKPGPKTECTVNFRPVLSSERVPHFRIKTISSQEKKKKNLLMVPKVGIDSKIDWPTDRR